jgi:hypothetical protein
MQVVVAGLNQVRPGQLRPVCRGAYLDSRVRRAHGGRAGGQVYQEALNPGTLARERLAGGEFALRSRVEAVAKAY